MTEELGLYRCYQQRVDLINARNPPSFESSGWGIFLGVMGICLFVFIAGSTIDWVLTYIAKKRIKVPLG